MSTWMLPEKSYPADKYEFRVKYKGTSAACPQNRQQGYQDYY